MLRRRVVIVVGSLALAWGALEAVFALRSRRASPPLEPGSIFVASEEQLAQWRKRLEKLREGPPSKRIVNTFSARYGWANVPGGEGVYRSWEVSFNSIGARGAREVGEAPPPGVLRVACYGESFTFGSEVNDDETWTAVLEAASGGALEVLNLGVGGWGTDQALLRFRDTRDELRSEVVLMGVLSENIARNVNRLRNVYRPPTMQPLVKPRFILVDGELELLPVPYATEAELYQAGIDGSLGIDMAAHEWWAEERSGSWSWVLEALRSAREAERRREWWTLWKDPAGEPFQVSLVELEAFHAEAVAGGARFAAVVLFPTRSDILEEDRRLTLLTERLEAGGIPYLDLFDLVRARKRRGEPTYGDTHFTPETNAEVGRAIWAWLGEELGL